MIDLQPQGIYRLAYNINDHGLRGRPVVFLQYVKRSFDIDRAEVALIENNGTLGERYLVNPFYVIPEEKVRIA